MDKAHWDAFKESPTYCQTENSHTCEIPFVTAGRSTDLFCRLIHGQLALIPHFPRAA